MTKPYWTQRELEAMPTLNTGQFSDLKISTETFNVWVDRATRADGALTDHSVRVSIGQNGGYVYDARAYEAWVDFCDEKSDVDFLPGHFDDRYSETIYPDDGDSARAVWAQEFTDSYGPTYDGGAGLLGFIADAVDWHKVAENIACDGDGYILIDGPEGQLFVFDGGSA